PSFLSTAELQFLPALHAGSFFKDLHAAHFSGGAGFLPCAFTSLVNVMTTIAKVPSVHSCLGTILFTALVLTSHVLPQHPASADAAAASGSRRAPVPHPC